MSVVKDLALGLSAILALAAGGLLIWLAIRDPHRLRKVLSSRGELDFRQALRSRLDPSKFDLVLAEEVWLGIADCHGVKPGHLRLEDRFDRELEVKPALYDDENSCVNVFIDWVAKKRGIKLDYASIATIEDCLKALCRSSTATTSPAASPR